MYNKDMKTDKAVWFLTLQAQVANQRREVPDVGQIQHLSTPATTFILGH